MDGNDESSDRWTDFTLSPKSLFPGFASNHCFTKLASDLPSGGTVLETETGKGKDLSFPGSGDKFEEHENGLSDAVDTDNFVAKTGGSIAERRAGRFGFGSLKISTSRFQSSSALASPAARSPYLLKTPGLSPSALLESPVFLPNLQPSPTTGTFLLPHPTIDSGVNSEHFSAEKNKGSDDTTSFTFKPHIESISLPCYSTSQSQRPSNFDQSSEVEGSSAITQPPITGAFEFPTQFPTEATAKQQSEFSSLHDPIISSDMDVKADSDAFEPRCTVVAAAGVEVQHNSESNQGEDTGVDQTSDGDQKVVSFAGGSVSISEDGYSWRKYGQKQVKGSEFPRSYYKCTHSSCPVKKKVEHSYDGQVTEIVYRGAHNHPKPQPNRRSTFSSAASCGDLSDVIEGGGPANGEGGSVGRNDLTLGSDWRPDNLERTCSASVATDVSDPSPATEGKSVTVLESAGTPEHSTLASNDDDVDEDAATHGSMPVIGDDDNEPDLKRRKIEEGPLMETTLGSRAIREPRVIVQIESEVDILDDGYRWRKYGQKVVKGNPNPRSYYKCTHPGCAVRKHVERASHNLKCVLTTYEGKHNHEVPTARNSSHTNSGGGNSAQSTQNTQGALTFPRNSHLPKSEPQDLGPRSNRIADYNNNFLRPNYLGNFAGGPSSIYQMRFPPLPNNMLYSSFGVNPMSEPPSASMVPSAPSLSIPPPMGFPMPSNAAASNFDNQGRPPGLIQPNFTGHQAKDGDSQVLRPMQD